MKLISSTKVDEFLYSPKEIQGNHKVKMHSSFMNTKLLVLLMTLMAGQRKRSDTET